MNRRQQSWLLAAALAVLAPLAFDLPAWLCITSLLILSWRALTLWRRLPVPAHGLLLLLALAGVITIAAHYHTLFGRDPGIALLLLLLALKLMEANSLRDGHAAALLCYFLMLCQFPYAQSMVSAAMTLIAVVLTTAALVLLHHPRQAAPLRLAASMLAQAALFMLLLFVLFPRIEGPLWGLPGDAYAGLTGLAETMTPGSISRLSRSEAIAFRAEFSTRQPPQDALYWRGPVLSRFDGSSWSAGRPDTGSTLPYAAGGGASDYTVTLEPHDKLWLFALELPGVIPADGLITRDYQLLAKAPVRARLRYAMRSYPEIFAGRDESPENLRQARQLPLGANPRARLLAQAWRAESGDDGPALVRRMLDYYRSQDFSYTLNPPLLAENSIDAFLFESRRGFCEHYAASFVFMMRAAGLPARVVTGYQGGEINPVDHTLIVRQSDAHAWAEVWTRERGWWRVDPTAAVAPSRIEKNLAAALPENGPLLLLARPAFLWLHEMRFRWEALANAWNQQVLGYNPRRQREFLSSLGMATPDWQRMVTVLGVLSSLLLCAFSAWVLVERGQSRDPLQAAWNRLSNKLAGRGPRRVGGRGMARQNWEGPQDYAKRIGSALPEIAGEIFIIAELYQALRYGPVANPRKVQELNTLIRRLKP